MIDAVPLAVCSLILLTPLPVSWTLSYVAPELTTYTNINTNTDNILLVTSVTPTDSYNQYRKNRVSGFFSASIEASYLL